MDEGVHGARAVRLLAGFAVAAGAIHMVALADHFREHPAYGVFFVVVATGQLAWGAAIYRRPDARGSLAAAAVANLAVVAVWAASRTTGLPVGPEAGRPEAASMLDILATVDELAIVALVVAIREPAEWLGSWVANLTTEQSARFGTALATVTLFGIMLGDHVH